MFRKNEDDLHKRVNGWNGQQDYSGPKQQKDNDAQYWLLNIIHAPNVN
jgi:hypothetical protein